MLIFPFALPDVGDLDPRALLVYMPLNNLNKLRSFDFENAPCNPHMLVLSKYFCTNCTHSLMKSDYFCIFDTHIEMALRKAKLFKANLINEKR